MSISGFHPLDPRDEIKNIPNNCIVLKIRDRNIIDIYKKIYPVETTISFQIPFDFYNKENETKCFAIDGKKVGQMLFVDSIEDSCFDNHVSFNISNLSLILINKMKNIKTSYNLSSVLSPKGLTIFMPDEK